MNRRGKLIGKLDWCEVENIETMSPNSTDNSVEYFLLTLHYNLSVWIILRRASVLFDVDVPEHKIIIDDLIHTNKFIFIKGHSEETFNGY